MLSPDHCYVSQILTNSLPANFLAARIKINSKSLNICNLQLLSSFMLFSCFVSIDINSSFNFRKVCRVRLKKKHSFARYFWIETAGKKKQSIRIQKTIILIFKIALNNIFSLWYECANYLKCRKNPSYVEFVFKSVHYFRETYNVVIDQSVTYIQNVLGNKNNKNILFPIFCINSINFLHNFPLYLW